MKIIHIKKKSYVLLTLFFCINLQGIKLDQIRRPTPHHAKPPKQNNTESQNMPDWNTIPEPQNSAGAFDHSFAPAGYTINPMGFKSEPRAVITQPNNKIVVAGVRDDYPVLARYNDNNVNRDSTIGVLDKSFGINNYGPGVVIQTSLGKGSHFNAVAIQEQPDQRIIGVGKANGKCMLACYNPNGTLNTFFGTYGIITTNINGELNAVAIQKDSKIVVAGYNPYNASDTRIILMRYDKNGLPDTNFGSQGVVYTHAGKFSRANAITTTTIHGENKIVIVGTINTGNQNNMVVARYHDDGSLDHSFGPDRSGVITIPVGKNNSIAYDVIVQKDGQTIIVGSGISQNDRSLFIIIRLNENGFFDTSFGTNGIIAATPTNNPSDNAYARSVVLDKDEKIIVMGYIRSHPFNLFSLARFNPNGTPDTAFGNYRGSQSNALTRFTRTDFNQAEIPVLGTIQNDKNKLVLAGMYSGTYSRTASLMAVARYLN